jgi:hypothetical protein
MVLDLPEFNLYLYNMFFCGDGRIINNTDENIEFTNILQQMTYTELIKNYNRIYKSNIKDKEIILKKITEQKQIILNNITQKYYKLEKERIVNQLKKIADKQGKLVELNSNSNLDLNEDINRLIKKNLLWIIYLKDLQIFKKPVTLRRRNKIKRD